MGGGDWENKSAIKRIEASAILGKGVAKNKRKSLKRTRREHTGKDGVGTGRSWVGGKKNVTEGRRE